MDFSFNHPRLPFGNGNEAQMLAALHKLTLSELRNAEKIVTIKRLGAIVTIGCGAVGSVFAPFLFQSEVSTKEIFAISHPVIFTNCIVSSTAFVAGKTLYTLSRLIEASLKQEPIPLARDFAVVKQALKNKGIKPPGKRSTIKLPDLMPKPIMVPT